MCGYPVSGIAMLAAVQRFDTERPIVLITAYAHIALAIQAIREGDYDFIEKPFSAGADPRSMSPCPSPVLAVPLIPSASATMEQRLARLPAEPCLLSVTISSSAIRFPEPTSPPAARACRFSEPTREGRRLRRQIRRPT